ncbi:urea ABC transporter ATP-binding protein UrtD [Hydrogenibacillus schlegelii]|uniref:Urea ABC transporter ATP-binding protein UrtD n=1 Tax=Hydrogenibacillus schlegelii TaxID=1484 RepID=A0A179IRH3_HYDSH|nr:urea ABC transporter ATP-binding protein UrtD [Hydrogenibacillus schlegelii]OAR04399.1 urea ABC transporter ATP-binding protein UrtD [Hydrogenibacillus schlegelii]
MTGGALRVENLTVEFDGFKAIDGLNFSLQEGELRFLIGPNGAGKTTLIDVISGRVRPTAGRVFFGHSDLSRLQEHEIVALGIARKFQTPSVFPHLTVWENLELALGFRERLPALLRPLGREGEERIAATLATVGLEHRAGQRAGTLSHGEKQWLEIGMLLIQEPRLLLLDEPVAGMTRRERELTGQLLHRIAPGRMILVVEHDMEFLRRFAHTVTVMHEGRILSEGTVEAVQSDPRVVEIYLGRGRQRGKGQALTAG